jgi:hypothetical protein
MMESAVFLFLYAPGGTRKTFLITLILATIRLQNCIELPFVSSVIAATLLEGGQTAHSSLKLLLDMQINQTQSYNLSRNSAMAKVLQQSKLIICVECTMAYQKYLKALDRTLNDLQKNHNRFGGSMILLVSDFRLTLAVIPRSTPAE